MSRPTFFGEVRDLTSRAIWSDDEEEEILETGDQFVASIDIENFSLINLIYLTLTKGVPNEKDLNEFKKISSILVETDKNNQVSVGQVFLFDSTLWLTLEEKHKLFKSHYVVKIVNCVLKEIFLKFHNQKVPAIIMISKEPSASNYITYLKTGENLPIEVTGQEMLVPNMITNTLEATVFQYCLLRNYSCCIFLLPLFDDTSHLPIPAVILDNVSKLKAIPESNLFL